ncbi:unnamed protein product [Brassica oleracea]
MASTENLQSSLSTASRVKSLGCYEAGGGEDSSKHVFHYKDFRCEKAERFLLCGVYPF